MHYFLAKAYAEQYVMIRSVILGVHFPLSHSEQAVRL